MKNEAEFKTKFKKSVSAQKGSTISLSAPVFPGIPDLYCIMPSYMPILLEAKWLGEVERDTFARKMQYTAMQLRWLEECDQINAYSALGLAGFKWKNAYYAVMVPCNSKFFNCIAESFLEGSAYSVLTNGKFDVMSMFEKIPIPRLNYGFAGRTSRPGQPEADPSQAHR